MHILVVNSGSSSIKYSLFDADGPSPRPLSEGEIHTVGNADPVASLRDAVGRPGLPAIDAVGYRVVHPGPRIDGHRRVTPGLLKDLEQAVVFAPLHDPQAVTLIQEMMGHFPKARHYACFDTIFHQTMPVEASTYAIPAAYRTQGVRRYGFHGLSCEGVVADFREAAAQGKTPFPRRMVIAHLGSGCSVTALLDGRSIENSMGLTPTGGVVMGTRPGDLDPGLVLYLLRQQDGDGKTAVTSVEKMLNHEAGMVALSELPNDMRATRKAAAGGNSQARLAIDIFTRTVRNKVDN